MAGPYLFDRVKETSTTTGTGTITLAGAVSGFQSFSVVGDGNTCYYAIVHQSAAEWEVGIGTYTASGTTLARTTILASSNSGNAVSFSAGTKDVFLTAPASIIGNAMRPPEPTNIAGTFTSSGTSTVVTMTAPAVGGTLLALVSARSRGCNSITQTNVTWTQLATTNGNSQFLEIWKGVVSASPGTTATFAFTGSNGQQCTTFEVPTIPVPTTATSKGSSTSASQTIVMLQSTGLTLGRTVIFAVAANNPSSSYGASSNTSGGISLTGGALRASIHAANQTTQADWGVFSSSIANQAVTWELT